MKPSKKNIARGLVCPYCEERTDLADSSEVYGKSFGMIRICRPCKAWVGCHRNSKKNRALGRVANATLRNYKSQAHKFFDNIWQRKMIKAGISKSRARGAAYRWLSDSMKIPEEDCHIGMFDEAQCQRVIELCQPYYKAKNGRITRNHPGSNDATQSRNL